VYTKEDKNTMDKKVVSIIIALVIVLGGVVAFGVVSSKKAAAPVADIQGTVYFFGAECPHCKKINEFLEKNDIASRVSFEKKEVWNDKTNAAQMLQAATQCSIDKKDVGVPFVFDNGQCLIGEPDVRKFFTEKAGL
jgi:glutaredoxin